MCACCRYDALSSCLVDFKGRASIASVKNFQVVKSEPMGNPGPTPPATAADPSSVMLQMGKVITAVLRDVFLALG